MEDKSNRCVVALLNTRWGCENNLFPWDAKASKPCTDVKEAWGDLAKQLKEEILKAEKEDNSSVKRIGVVGEDFDKQTTDFNAFGEYVQKLGLFLFHCHMPEPWVSKNTLAVILLDDGCFFHSLKGKQVDALKDIAKQYLPTYKAGLQNLLKYEQVQDEVNLYEQTFHKDAERAKETIDASGAHLFLMEIQEPGLFEGDDDWTYGDS